MNVSELKRKILSLSDAELKTLIISLASAYGLETSKTKTLTDDLGKTRRTLASLSDKQISRLLSALGRNSRIDVQKELISRLGSDRTQ